MTETAAPYISIDPARDAEWHKEEERLRAEIVRIEMALQAIPHPTSSNYHKDREGWQSKRRELTRATRKVYDAYDALKNVRIPSYLDPMEARLDILSKVRELPTSFEQSKEDFIKRFDHSPSSAIEWIADEIVVAEEKEALKNELFQVLSPATSLVDLRARLDEYVRKKQERLLSEIGSGWSSSPFMNAVRGFRQVAHRDFLRDLEWTLVVWLNQYIKDEQNTAELRAKYAQQSRPGPHPPDPEDKHENGKERTKGSSL